MQEGFKKYGNAVFREIAWFAIFVFWAYYKKPAGQSFLAIRLDALHLIGLVLVLLGIVIHVWSAVILSAAISQRSVALVGPFSHVRNPIYLSGAAVFVGLYLAYAEFRFLDLIVALVAALLLHLFVIYREEATARQRLGNVYEQYTKRVPRWLPRLRRQF
jgi:protein-S-isoprenylcysteine O-methyltransferase Ste14